MILASTIYNGVATAITSVNSELYRAKLDAKRSVDAQERTAFQLEQIRSRKSRMESKND